MKYQDRVDEGNDNNFSLTNSTMYNYKNTEYGCNIHRRHTQHGK